jgi:hypothetical protein
MALCRVHVERHGQQKHASFADARAVEGGMTLFVYRDAQLLARFDLASIRSWWIEETAP